MSKKRKSFSVSSVLQSATTGGGGEGTSSLPPVPETKTTPEAKPSSRGGHRKTSAGGYVRADGTAFERLNVFIPKEHSDEIKADLMARAGRNGYGRNVSQYILTQLGYGHIYEDLDD